MNELLSGFRGGRGLTLNVAFAPEMDVAEKDNSFELRLDIP